MISTGPLISPGARRAGPQAAPARSLDQLFRKTAAQPEIYWAPNPPDVAARRRAHLRVATAAAAVL